MAVHAQCDDCFLDNRSPSASNFRVFHPSRLFKAPLHRSDKFDDSFHELPLVYPKREAVSRDAHYTALNANVNALKQSRRNAIQNEIAQQRSLFFFVFFLLFPIVRARNEHARGKIFHAARIAISTDYE